MSDCVVSETKDITAISDILEQIYMRESLGLPRDRGENCENPRGGGGDHAIVTINMLTNTNT